MKTPFKRILVALDRSAAANNVFDLAIALAQQNCSHLMLTHCVSVKTLEQLGTLIDAGFGLASPAKLQRLQDEHLNEVNEAWQWLCDHALQAQAQGIFAEVTCQAGEAGVQICSLAQQWEAALIIIGHGKPSLKEKLFGSTTHYVRYHAPCSIMIVQPENSPQCLRHPKTPKTLVNGLHQFDERLAQSIWNLRIPIAGTQ
jgi:nucleotide-binding universal stress UspA family protein